MPHRARPALALMTALFLIVGLSAPAAATEQTFKRAMTNLLFGPFDIALSPIVGPRSVYQNLQDIDDTTGVRIAYAVPGVAWNTAFNIGGGMLRVMSGLLEIVPGILLLPFEGDMNPLFAPPERADALIGEETSLTSIKGGSNHMS